VTPAEHAALIAAVAAVPAWWHSIPLAPGIITPGWKTPAQHDAEWVLYHQADPWGALTRLAGLTRGQLLIETEAVVIPGANPALPLWALRDTLPTCWWIPTLAGLTEALRGVGLSRVTVRTPLPIVSPQEPGARHYRLTVQGRA
jgi:hypothetical protein